MKQSTRTGLSFGLTSAVITTLGLMTGLHSESHSRSVVLGGILTIAVADSFSDALGIHVSEEAENVHSAREVWLSTGVTFLTKFLFALTFAVPVLLLPLRAAVAINLAWGFGALAIMSHLIARREGQASWKVVGEHLLIAVAVIVIAHFVGEAVGALGGS